VFRRTYITPMAEAGALINYVQDQVGHESAQLTLEIYARVSRARPCEVGPRFDELMAGVVAEESDLKLFDLTAAEGGEDPRLTASIRGSLFALASAEFWQETG
jgi:hypothetical protein